MGNLYIVAKICNYPEIVVVPLRNIYRFDYAKSLNNRINRNQTHLLYWSPDETKNPDFNLPISNRFDASTDSCFNVKLLKVFGNRQLAIAYKNKRRNIAPALYNRKRLNEKPYPAKKSTRNQQINRAAQRIQNKQQPKRVHTKVAVTVVSVAMDTQASSSFFALYDSDCEACTPTSIDGTAFNNSGEGENECDPEMNIRIEMDTPPSSPLLVSDSDLCLEEVGIDDSSPAQSDVAVCDNSSEEVVCLSDIKNIKTHRPMKTFDVLSGGYSFLQTPKGDRIYTVNDKRFKLTKNIVDRLLYYNKSPTSSANPNIDKTFVELLLLSVFKVESLKQNKIDTDLLAVIKGFYKNRVGRDKVRMGNFDNYMRNKCCELRKK